MLYSLSIIIIIILSSTIMHAHACPVDADIIHMIIV